MTFESIRDRAQAAWQEFAGGRWPRILVGAGTCGLAAGAGDVIEAIRRHMAEAPFEADLYEVGCLGLCYAEPLVELSNPGGPRVLYGAVTADDIPRLLDGHFAGDGIAANAALAVMEGGPTDGVPSFDELPMLRGQVRIVLRNCGLIDPGNIYHYIVRGGYAGLARAFEQGPERVIEEVRNSGLRGRGGAGFPTGVKWDFCRRAPGTDKYLICNADEGDPGAFMDRSVLESDPHSVLEGMAIAAYAIGAAHGYIYVRAEYPLAIERLEKALAQARELDLLGDDILGSGFGFHVRLKKGAGAFVCGEETALLASIEGRRGMPRPRPPFPAQKGLHGKPTNINNVETLANISTILERGSGWFSQYGTEKSPGTKTFALAGKIRRTGLIEVPMGLPLREIVYNIGGGIPDDRRIKAVQTGGPSGGCIPATLLEMPVDYEKLAEAGTIMGSGGMVVMDEDTCMVDIAQYFVEFTRNESCGKCAPCRLGTRQMLSILQRITRGEGRPEDIGLLEEIGMAVKAASLCGLGQTAPNPVLTTIRYFADEYEAHIRRKKCPAAVCRSLVQAPCKHVCPAGVDVPRYIRCIAAGRYGEALDVIRARNPFPAVCGWVCFHPCEAKCRRAELDDAVAVRALKRFAVEHGADRRSAPPPRPEPTGKRVAVVGSGPAGLTAAYYLTLQGHAVTVLEREAKPGGTLRTAIPIFRLPREVIEADIEEITRAGVRICTGTEVHSVDSLFEQGYDAVLLAYGAQSGLKMDIPGCDAPGVFDALSLLRCVNSGERPRLGARVAVVGGGSSAMDAARTALRLGAEDVRVIYRRTRAEMPAAAEELEEALAEGVQMQFLVTPTEIGGGDGGLSVECVRMRQGTVDRSGRLRPVPIEGSEFVLETDSVIMAIGQAPELLPEVACDVDKRGRLLADEATGRTSVPGVFAAGDAVTGPASIIDAVAAGRTAAAAMDLYLGGDGDIGVALAPEADAGELPEVPDERPRQEIRKRPPAERAADFDAVELGFTEESAVAEAGRCLRCDLEKFED